MVTRADVLAVFGVGDLITYGEDALSQVELPRDAREVLRDIGVPRREEPLFEAAVPTMMLVPGRDQPVCRFGSDFGTDLCIVPDSGEVISASSHIESTERFVNSSLSQFIEFLVQVTTQRREFAGLADSEVDRRVRELEVELTRFDGNALSGPDNWWAVIVEQPKAGLL